MQNSTMYNTLEMTFRMWRKIFWGKTRKRIVNMSSYTYFLTLKEAQKWQRSYNGVYYTLFKKKNKKINVLDAIQMCDGGFMRQLTDDDVQLHPFGFNITLH